MYNIGDFVYTSAGVKAVITDKMYSDKKKAYYYGISYDDMCEDDEDIVYHEADLYPYEEEKTDYSVDIAIDDGVVVCNIYEVTGDTKKHVCRGHAHILHNGIIGIAQAVSYASRRAFMSVNNNSTTIEKEY